MKSPPFNPLKKKKGQIAQVVCPPAKSRGAVVPPLFGLSCSPTKRWPRIPAEEEKLSR